MRIIKHAATGSQRRAVADRPGEGKRAKVAVFAAANGPELKQ